MAASTLYLRTNGEQVSVEVALHTFERCIEIQRAGGGEHLFKLSGAPDASPSRTLNEFGFRDRLYKASTVKAIIKASTTRLSSGVITLRSPTLERRSEFMRLLWLYKHTEGIKELSDAWTRPPLARIPQTGS